MTDEPAWVSDVLGFWFGELAEADWFRKSDATDALIRQRFMGLHEKLLADGEVSPGAGARTLLAAIIVLDQFSRNMFCGTARAFAADPHALHMARAAVAKGLDQDRPKNERLFMYLPFEHSEDFADQEISVALMAKLEDEELLGYATAHRDIIKRFARFPHRNALVGRQSTEDEIEFLKQPGSSF